MSNDIENLKEKHAIQISVLKEQRNFTTDQLADALIEAAMKDRQLRLLEGEIIQARNEKHILEVELASLREKFGVQNETG